MYARSCTLTFRRKFYSVFISSLGNTSVAWFNLVCSGVELSLSLFLSLSLSHTRVLQTYFDSIVDIYII